MALFHKVNVFEGRSV